MNLRCPLLPAVVHRLPIGCGPSTDRAGSRSRLVADAFGLRSSATRDRSGRPGSARPIPASTRFPRLIWWSVGGGAV